MRLRAKDRIESLGMELFGSSDPDQISQKFIEFFAGLGSPVKCFEAGIESSRNDEILFLMNQNIAKGQNYSLSDHERQEILSYTW